MVPRQKPWKWQISLDSAGVSAGREGERRGGRGFLGRLVIGRAGMRAAGAALLGAGAEGFVDDGLDRARATAALGAAPEASVDLLRISRQVRSCTHGIPDIVVAQDVAGTDDHETKRTLSDAPHRYGSARRDAKGKAAFSSNSKLMPAKDWNESKQRCCGKSDPPDLPASSALVAATAAAVSATSSAVSAAVAG